MELKLCLSTASVVFRNIFAATRDSRMLLNKTMTPKFNNSIFIFLTLMFACSEPKIEPKQQAKSPTQLRIYFESIGYGGTNIFFFSKGEDLIHRVNIKKKFFTYEDSLVIENPDTNGYYFFAVNKVLFNSCPIFTGKLQEGLTKKINITLNRDLTCLLGQNEFNQNPIPWKLWKIKKSSGGDSILSKCDRGQQLYFSSNSRLNRNSGIDCNSLNGLWGTKSTSLSEISWGNSGIFYPLDYISSSINISSESVWSNKVETYIFLNEMMDSMSLSNKEYYYLEK